MTRVLVAVGAILLAGGEATAAPAPGPLPTPLGFVSDFAGVIDPATRELLRARLYELRKRTRAEIAVVTVETTAPDTAFDYAVRLAEAWKPGAAGEDNGVVFLVAVRDRELFIATGYGLEGALPDGLVGEIRDRVILPRFRAGDLAGGIVLGVERLSTLIAREYGVALAPSPEVRAVEQRTAGRPASARIGALDLLVLVLLVALLVWLVSRPAALGPGARRRGYRAAGPLWGGSFGGGGFGGPGGGFGGFGGGGFGGGGAGGRW
jgi:uncharacterized protein